VHPCRFVIITTRYCLSVNCTTFYKCTTGTISINAQIVYTDIVPDGMPANRGLDFNGDGTNEYNNPKNF